MKSNSEPNPELVAWLIDLNTQVAEASEEEREEMFKELREDTLEQFFGAAIEPFMAFIILRFQVLPPLIKAAGIELHEALDGYYLDEIMDSTKTPEDFLYFCQLLFPMLERAGIVPLANERMLDKLQEVLGPEAMMLIKTNVQITPRETFQQLLSFLSPYIDQAMKDPFAQNDVIIEDEEGKRPCGKYYHVFSLIKEVLEKFSTPDSTVTQ